MPNYFAENYFSKSRAKRPQHYRARRHSNMKMRPDSLLEHQVDFEVFDSKYVKTKVEIPHKREQTTKLQQTIPITKYSETLLRNFEQKF